MKIQINNISKNDIKEWSSFLSNHPENSVFQSTVMYDFYSRVDNYNPHVFISRNSNRVITGILLAVEIMEFSNMFGWMSSRVIVYGGPVISLDNNSSTLNSILNSFNDFFKNKVVYSQIRSFKKHKGSERDIFYANGFNYSPWTNIKVNTETIEKAQNGISKSRLRQIEKANKSGVIVRAPISLNEVEVFYRLLSDLYKSKIKKPLPSLSFFENFYKFSQKNKLGIMRLLLLNDVIIGGYVASITSNKAIHEWYITGLDKSFKSNYPSVILTWNMIEYALVNGYEYFDFLGAGSLGTDYGVRKFKLGFSKNLLETDRYEKTYYPIARRMQIFGYKVLMTLRMFN